MGGAADRRSEGRGKERERTIIRLRAAKTDESEQKSGRKRENGGIVP